MQRQPESEALGVGSNAVLVAYVHDLEGNVSSVPLAGTSGSRGLQGVCRPCLQSVLLTPLTMRLLGLRYGHLPRGQGFGRHMRRR